MTQFSPTDASNTAMLIKKMIPNIDDVRLSQLVQQAAAVQNDPVRSQAFAQKLQSFRQANGGIVDDSGENDNGNSDAGTVQQPFIPASNVSSNIPPAYATPGVANQDLTSSLGQAGAGLQQGNINNVQAANALAAQTGNLANQQAAEQAYQQSIANLAPARSAANFMAATGGPQVAAQSSASWDKLNEQNKDLTLGAVQRQQDFAKNAISNYQAGVTMAGNVLDQMDKSGKFNIDANAAALAQKKLQLELIGHAATAENTQALMDPTSPMSLAARQGAIKTLKLAGYDDATIAKMVPDNMPGIQAAPIAAATGTTLANMKTVADTLSTQAGTGKTQAETTAIGQSNKIVAADQGLPIPGGDNAAPAFNFTPGTDLRVMRAAMAAQPANVLAAFDKQYPGVAAATGPVPAPESQAVNASAISKLQRTGGVPTPTQAAQLPTPSFGSLQSALATGKPQPDNHNPDYLAETDAATLSPVQQLERKALTSTNAQEIIGLNKQVSAANGTPYKAPGGLSLTNVSGGTASMGQNDLLKSNMGHTSADISSTQQQLAGFTQTGKTAAQSAILDARLGGLQAPNMVTGGNPAAQNFANNVNKLNADAQNLGVLAKGENNAGALLTAGGTAIAAGAPGGLAKMGGVALSALGGLLGGGQAITAKSDPKVIAATGVAVQEVAAKKQMLLAQQQAYADQHNGDGTGFINSPIYKTIVNAIPLINPKTGDVIVPITAQDRIAAKQKGYGNASIYIGAM